MSIKYFMEIQITTYYHIQKVLSFSINKNTFLSFQVFLCRNSLNILLYALYILYLLSSTTWWWFFKSIPVVFTHSLYNIPGFVFSFFYINFYLLLLHIRVFHIYFMYLNILKLFYRYKNIVDKYFNNNIIYEFTF